MSGGVGWGGVDKEGAQVPKSESKLPGPGRAEIFHVRGAPSAERGARYRGANGCQRVPTPRDFLLGAVDADRAHVPRTARCFPCSLTVITRGLAHCAAWRPG